MYVIILTHERYMLPFQFFFLLPYMPTWNYPTKNWKTSSHDFLTPNMNLHPSVLNFTESECSAYYEWLEQFISWGGTSEHVVHTMNFKTLNDATNYFLFHYNLFSTEKSTASNIHLECLCGELYPFIKPIPVRDKQSESFLSIDYKLPLDSREDKGMCLEKQGRTTN